MEKPTLRPDHRRRLAVAAPTDSIGEWPAGGLAEAAAGRVVGRSVLLLVAAVIGLVLSAQLGSVFLRLFVAAILAAAMTPPVDAVAALLGRSRWAPPRARSYSARPVPCYRCRSPRHWRWWSTSCAGDGCGRPNRASDLSI